MTIKAKEPFIMLSKKLLFNKKWINLRRSEREAYIYLLATRFKKDWKGELRNRGANITFGKSDCPALSKGGFVSAMKGLVKSGFVYLVKRGSFPNKKSIYAIKNLDVITDKAFYESREWRNLRYKVLKKHGAKCQCCGRSAKDGIIIHVDHIKPRSKFPELELNEDNLQILCEDCNLGKSNRDDTDWRAL